MLDPAPLTPEVRHELQLFLAVDSDEVFVAWYDDAYKALEAATIEDPQAIVAAILEPAPSGEELRNAIERVWCLSMCVPESKRALVGELLAAGGETAEAAIDEFDLDDVDLTPLMIPALVAAAGDEDYGWAQTHLVELARRGDWPTVALALDAAARADSRALWLGRALDNEEWARTDPPPSPDARVPVLPRLEHEQMAIPVSDLYTLADPRVVRARHEAAAIAAEAERWAAEGRSPAPWLRRLGDGLPGCGVPWCCRTGLFELALWELDLNPRGGRFPPHLMEPVSPADGQPPSHAVDD